MQSSTASSRSLPSGAPSQLAYIEVAIPLRVMQTFTYKLPSAIKDRAATGARVLVPFKNKLVTGYIVALLDIDDSSGKAGDRDIKEAADLLDHEPLLTVEVMKIARWVAEYYAAPLGEVLKAALPAGLNSRIEQILTITPKGREEVSTIPKRDAAGLKWRLLHYLAENGEASLADVARHVPSSRISALARDLERAAYIETANRARSPHAGIKQSRAVRLTPEGGKAVEEPARFTDAQSRMIKTLMEGGGELSRSGLLEKAKAGASTLRTLEKRGFVEVVLRDIRRNPLANQIVPDKEDLELNAEQSRALEQIETQLKQHRYAAFLLHGVTGSGKTEVYIRAMSAALRQGRSAMMLVPEIALTPVFSQRLRSHFGDLVAIIHSSLTTGERFDEWKRIKEAKARVIIGTRSAVFAPVSNLGVIIVDEEHETSYRQQESPYYHGRDTAIVRARNESAVIVLGSATPSLESFHNAQIGKYKYLRLANRIWNRAMACAEIIDMREVFADKGRPVVFSDRLLDAIRETHRRGEQSIILLNRRGYSSFVLCRSCGESIQCPNCDVTLTYHRREASLICHYCDHRQKAPSKCPACEGKYIYYVGEGTEKLEEILRKTFPELRISRLDRDTTSRRRLFERAIQEFGAGELDMLVGTQMLAKGHDFPNVTLVGVVSVDAGLSLPDFRSAERTFQLITQVAGRAGRGDRPGLVLIQTYHPSHYALKYACAQDYEGFYSEELRHRRNMSYPPYVALASILVHGENINRVHTLALELKKSLSEANSHRACRILGPAPAPLARLRGEHRSQILIKSNSRPLLREAIDKAMSATANRGHDLRSVNIEIDPVNLM